MIKNRDYSKGKIYKIEPIVEHEPNEIYIGSTTKEYLSQRMATHKGDYIRWKNNKRGKVMVFDLFDKYEFCNCEIILLENYIASSKDDLLSREKYFIQSIGCLNKYIPGRTLEEYKTENKDALNEKERQRNRTSERVAYQKERYDKIKEKKLEQSRKRYQEKKEQILARQKEKIICICGCTVTRNEISQHKKTKKHNNLMKNINI